MGEFSFLPPHYSFSPIETPILIGFSVYHTQPKVSLADNLLVSVSDD